MVATSTRRTPRKSPPARKSKSPSPKGRKSKSPSPAPALTPTAASEEEEEEEDDELDTVSPRPAAEQGIDSIMQWATDNSTTIIICFMAGTVRCRRCQ